METFGGDLTALDPLWEKTLFNQFHDIMPGSCSPDAYEQALVEVKSVQSDYRDMSYHILKKQTARMVRHIALTILGGIAMNALEMDPEHVSPQVTGELNK
jgi:hypothetical protein